MVPLSSSSTCNYWITSGGWVDDDNDDQDGGMLIPAYSRSEVWNFLDFQIQPLKKFQ